MKQALTAGGLISVWFESVRLAFDEMGIDFEEDRALPGIKGTHPEYGPIVIEFFVPVQGKTRMEIAVRDPQLIAEFKKAVIPAYKRVSALVIQQTKSAMEKEAREKMQQQETEEAQNKPEVVQPEPDNGAVLPEAQKNINEICGSDAVTETEHVPEDTNTNANANVNTNAYVDIFSDYEPKSPEPKANVKTCKHCKAELQEGTKVCPRCGKKQGNGLVIAAIIVGAVILIGVIGFVVYTFVGKGNGSSQTNVSQTNTSVNTEDTNNTQTVGQSQLVTLDQYNQVQVGMTYEQVCGVMGREGTFLEPETKITGENGEVTTLKTYYWEAEGPEGANVCVTFQDGAVATISQYGLQ